MNKFKLFALAAFAMLSTNALADVGSYVVKDGLIYKVVTEFTKAAGETPAVPGTVTLEAIADNTKGAAIKTAKAVSVPSLIEVTIDDEENTYKVIGTADTWESTVTSDPDPAGQDLSEVIETLSIDVTNFGAALANTAIDGFTKLATLTIIDNTVEDPDGDPVVVSNTQALPDIPATVTSLDIEKTCIKEIATGKFNGSKLKTIKLPQVLTTIKGSAFLDCADLEGTIVIPATVQNIGSAAFKNAAKADFDLSKAAALVRIYPSAFQNSGITTANLNASVKLTHIDDYAFNAENLAKLQMSGLSKGVLKVIGEGAFAGTKITAANIPATVTTLGEGAFAGCEELTTLSKMAGLLAIPANAFAGDVKLASVSIAEGVASIGEAAFGGCKALATVTIMTNEDGESALTIWGDNVFAECEALESIDLSATKITAINGNLKAQFLGCKALKEVKVPATLTTIGAQAFGGCVIENLDLSETGVKALHYIFRYDTDVYPSAKKPYASLKSIKLPEVLESIDGIGVNGVFQYCTGLTEITIPEGVTEVPSYTFQYCTALETATVSDGDVAEKAFWYCDKLKTFNYLDTDLSNDGTDYVSADAFLGCTPFINFVTTATYQTEHPDAPQNAKYGTSANAKMKTVADKGTSGKAFGYFWNTTGFDVVLPKTDDMKFYSIYVDEGIAYFQGLRTFGGKYIIQPDAKIIMKSDAPMEFEYETKPVPTPAKESVLVDEVWAVSEDTPLAEFQSAYVNAGEYVYRLTNSASTGGFGFTFFTGTTMKAGQFFIISTKKPAGAARLNVVWLDENGFVEEDGATAIQKVEAAEVENAPVYNMQGVRVNAAKKGLYIQNGKKFIVK